MPLSISDLCYHDIITGGSTTQSVVECSVGWNCAWFSTIMYWFDYARRSVTWRETTTVPIVRSSNYSINNWNFQQTQLPGYAATERYGRSNDINKFIFDIKMSQNCWQLELRPRPHIKGSGFRVRNTVGEDGHKETMNLPSISISWLRHCGKFKSQQKAFFLI